MSDPVVQLPTNRAIVLYNATCAYCGQPFDTSVVKTKEHVIGRRFVPKGILDGQWNLILNACKDCNGDKADLEDDISAISMMPDQFGCYAIDDARLQAEVQRKATKAQSRRTGRAVSDSREQIEIKGSLGAATFTFKLTAPAQVEQARLYRLAHYHFRGFFYWLTYQLDRNFGSFIHGAFFPLTVVRRSDWGAPRPRWFMEIARDWQLCLCAIGADTFFKVLIRRHPENLAVWLWALEWNHSMRIVGFAGNEDVIRSLLSSAPDQPNDLRYETDKELTVLRKETSLPEDDDDLFNSVGGL